MSLILFLLLLQVLFSESLYSSVPEVKALVCYKPPAGKNLPIINPDNGEKITIEFDLSSNSYPEISLIFKPCDHTGIPLKDQYFYSRNENIFRNPAFEYLPVTVTDARYHFSGSFPDSRAGIDFFYRTKWMFLITDSFDTSRVFASGYFYVVADQASADAGFITESMYEAPLFPVDLSKALTMNINFKLPDGYFPDYFEAVEVIENNKFYEGKYYPGKMRSDSVLFRSADGSNYQISIRGIRPGNSYRQIDITNQSKYQGEQAYATPDGTETSRFYFRGDKDNNGSSIIAPFHELTSDYITIKFRFTQPEESKSHIYLNGSFNHWNPQRMIKMEKSGNSYTASLRLKRGIYDYQYVCSSAEDINNYDPYLFEGNFFETDNRYTILFYYKDQQNRGYSKIIKVLSVHNGK